MATQQPRLLGLPPQGQGKGNWYLSKEPTKHYCRHCRDWSHEQVGVLEYLPEIDFDRGMAIQYLGLDEKGWLIWWECDNCADVRFEVADTQRIAKVGRTLGGWKER